MCGSGFGRSRGTSRSLRSRGLGARLVPITSFGSSKGSLLLNSDVIVLVFNFLCGVYVYDIWVGNGVIGMMETYDDLFGKMQEVREMYESHFFRALKGHNAEQKILYSTGFLV